MELCDYDLNEYIERNPQSLCDPFSDPDEYLRLLEKTMTISVQISKGLIYMYECGKVHRDLKPNNGILSST